MTELKKFTKAEVAKHNQEDDQYVIVDGKVLDISAFADAHPGGKNILTQYAGQDVTEQFYALHRSDVLNKYLPKLQVGDVTDGTVVDRKRKVGTLSQVPYAEASAWNGFKSPYYNDSHKKFRAALRKWYDEAVLPIGPSHEDSGKAPSKELWLSAGKVGMLTARIGPGSHLKSFPEIGLPGGIKHEEFDYFHELIAHEENSSLGLPSFIDGLGAGLVIGLPPVIHFAKNKELQKKVVGEVLRGEKTICLAISEPFAGSDVANIKTTAVKTSDGKHYIVNGCKKWITNGTFCDYFTTAVRTGPPGIGGVSLLLIERGPGLETELIPTSYGGAAGTAYISMENVKVPVENLLGEEHQGFKCIMANFNHERWLIIAGVIRATRLVVEECFKWSNQRQVFGKSLLQQPVIREKLAHMIAQVESVHNWLESITYQMTKMSYNEQVRYLAGPIALLKLQCTRVAYSVSDHACQIFGGRAITRNGMGQIVERFQRSLKYGAILGGSEEIMADLGVRQAMKYFPQNARL